MTSKIDGISFRGDVPPGLSSSLAKIGVMRGHNGLIAQSLLGRPGRFKTISYDSFGIVGSQRSTETTYRLPDVSHRVEQYFDGFGTVYRTLRFGEFGTVETQRIKEWSSGIGAFLYLSKPYFTTEGLQFWHRVGLDLRGRPTGVSLLLNGRDFVRQLETYDYQANQITITDAQSQSTKIVFDQFGRIDNIIDPAGSVTDYTYNEADLLTSVVLPNGDRDDWRYDGWGRTIYHEQSSTLRPMMGARWYEYDDLGNLLTETDGGGVSIDRSYDEVGRILSERATSGSEVYCYSYNGLDGTLREVFLAPNCESQTKAYQAQFSYDRRGNVITKVERHADLPGKRFGTTYAHDHENRLMTITFPDAAQQELLYSSEGWLKEVLVHDVGDWLGKTYASYVEYDAAGRVLTKRLPDGGETTYAYDEFDDLTRLYTSNQVGTALQRLDYLYFENHSLKKITDSRPNKTVGGVDTDTTQVFTYDALDRLKTASGGGYGNLTFDYDTAGFLTSKDALTYAYKVNGAAGCSGQTLSSRPISLCIETTPWRAAFDSLGRRIEFRDKTVTPNRGWNYLYDGWGRMTDAKSFAGSSFNGFVRFRYDHEGRRIWKSAELINRNAFNPILTYYVADGRYEIRKNNNSSDTSETKQIDTPHGPIASVTTNWHGGMPRDADMAGTENGALVGDTFFGVPAGAYWYHLNHLGSVEVVSDLGYRALVAEDPEWRDTNREMQSSRAGVVEDATIVSMMTTALVDTSDLGMFANPTARQRTIDAAAAQGVSLVAEIAEAQSADGDYDLWLDRLQDVHASIGQPAGVQFESELAAIGPLASVRARYLYQPFGEILRNRSIGFDLSTAKFTGQESDVETGLYYGARYYDSTTGLFLTPDSLIADRNDPRSLNRYSYVYNNPLRFVDPTGHLVFEPLSRAPLIDHPIAMTIAAELRRAAANVAPDLRTAVFTPNGLVAQGLELAADFLDPQIEAASDWAVFGVVPIAGVVVEGAAAAGELAATRSTTGRYIPGSQVMRERNGVVTQVRATASREAPAIRNSHLAGRTHPKTGVPFDKNGFPDFSTYRHPEVADVRIELSGSRSTDFGRANAAAGLKETPRGYTWHHHQDKGRMQLVERKVHETTGHTGGFSGP